MSMGSITISPFLRHCSSYRYIGSPLPATDQFQVKQTRGDSRTGRIGVDNHCETVKMNCSHRQVYFLN
jgi:hypothetical protein